MTKPIKLLMTAFIVFVAAAGSAQAAFNLRPLGKIRLPQIASRMEAGEREMAPIAFVKFCINYGNQCRSDAENQRIDLTVDTWTDLMAVNASVNERIRPDASKGPFDWSLDTTFGNCNDYAVQKRQALLDKGYPMSALALSVVVTSWGEGHLVLTVRTDRGDYVLDNLRHAIISWDRTGYHWIKVQSSSDPSEWEHPTPASSESRMSRADL